MRLQMLYNVRLKDRRSVIIFDEVQKYPNARQAVKYLVEDGCYDYIEAISFSHAHSTGSLQQSCS